MSEWKTIKRDDLDIEEDRKGNAICVNVYLGSNDSGNIYAEIKIEDLQELFKEHNKELNPIMGVGVSAWKAYGKRYGYWNYFKRQSKCE